MPIDQLKGLISDVVVPLTAEDVEKSAGLAFDIGSTIGKVIYRSNKEYKGGKPIKPKDDGRGQVHFAMFPRNDVDSLLAYIKENCDLTPNEEGKIMINSSGVGGASFKKKIQTSLDCKMEVISEADCFCQAFVSCKKSMTEEEMLLATPPMNEKIAAQNKKVVEAHEKMKDHSELDFTGGTTELDANFKRPVLLVMAGSGTGIMEIKDDESFGFVEGLHIAGRSMYGLAAALTGENDFKVLTELAEKGDGRTVDTWLSDLYNPEEKDDPDEENMYGGMMECMEDMSIFPFGKGVTVPLSEMKKEDLAGSVFSTIAASHASLVNLSAKLTKAKAVYFVGNVFNTSIMMRKVSDYKDQMSIMIPAHLKYDYHFVRNGGMYGALGAYLYKKK